MNVKELKVKKREGLGKKDTKNLRKQENVPCVLYGGEEVVHFYAHKNEFKDIVYTPNVYLLKIDVDGKVYDAIMHDIQFHAIDDSILHIDFLKIEDNKPFGINLPIKIVGSSPGVMAGGKLRTRRRYLKASGLAKDMPDSVHVDISSLNIGQGIKVSDIEVENIKFLDPADGMVVAVMTARAAAAATDEEEEAEGEAEGESSDE